MEVEDDVVHAFAPQPVEQPLDERGVPERDRGLRNQTSQRIEPGAETGGQNEGGRQQQRGQVLYCNIFWKDSTKMLQYKT
jgi:hypothetical protein